MDILDVIDKLQELYEREGHMEVTCMHSTLPEGEGKGVLANHFETTVENFVVNEPDDNIKFKRVRLWL